MTTKEIAQMLLNLLIENHEDGESFIIESAIGRICEARKLQNPTTDEISESVHLINSLAGYKIITESWIQKGGFTALLSSGYDSSYYTDKSLPYLKELLTKIEN
jgi:hypothetical protein